ncbi:MAG: plastocyanin/azurin family copper-binding protein [Candidatus Zixiibacteriota bacterium]
MRSSIKTSIPIVHFWVLIAIFSLASPARSGDIVGEVKRPPAQAEPTKVVDRYVGRDALPRRDNGANCICNPGLYSVAYLTGDSLPPIVPPKTPPAMAQKDMMFSPSVLAVAVGTTVSFPNDDPFFHNVFSYSKTKRFDLGRYPKGKTQEVVLDKPGIIKVFCEIHYSMRAYIHVLETPYFAVSDEKGLFAISSVKPGSYTLHIWQENLPEITQPITVTPETLKLEIR